MKESYDYVKMMEERKISVKRSRILKKKQISVTQMQMRPKRYIR